MALKRLTLTFGKLAFLQGLNFALPLATLPIIVRIIGPEKFGIINYLLAVQMWFVLLINYGFDISASRAVIEHKRDAAYINRLFWQVFYARISLLFVSMIIFALLYLSMPQLQLDYHVSIWTMIACASFVLTPNWLFQGKEELPKAAIFTVIGKLLFCISILYFIRQKNDYWLYALLTTIFQIIAGSGVFFLSCKIYKLHPVSIKIKEIWFLLSSNRTIFMTTLLLNFFVSFNTFILGLFRSQTEVGYFTAASRIVLAMQTIMLIPLSQTLFPHIGTAFQESPKSGLAQLRTYIKPVFVIGIGSTLILFLLAPLAIHILFGNLFDRSIGILQILSLASITYCLNNYLGTQAALNLHLDKSVFRILMLGLIFNITVNIILIKYWGEYGAAWSWVATDIFVFLLLNNLLRRNHIFIWRKNILTNGK